MLGADAGRRHDHADFLRADLHEEEGDGEGEEAEDQERVFESVVFGRGRVAAPRVCFRQDFAAEEEHKSADTCEAEENEERCHP